MSPTRVTVHSHKTPAFGAVWPTKTVAGLVRRHWPHNNTVEVVDEDGKRYLTDEWGYVWNTPVRVDGQVGHYATMLNNGQYQIRVGAALVTGQRAKPITLEPMVGDQVRIVQGAKMYKVNQCGFIPVVARFVGQVGTVRSLHHDGDLIVQFGTGGSTFVAPRYVVVTERPDAFEPEEVATVASFLPGQRVRTRVGARWIDSDGTPRPLLGNYVGQEFRVDEDTTYTIEGNVSLIGADGTTIGVAPQDLDLIEPEVQAAYGSPAQDVTEPGEVRDLLRTLHRVAIEHGYRCDWDELQEWFQETFGVSVDEFAGTTYTVSGKWSAWLNTDTRRLRFDGHIPHGTRLVSLGPVNSEGRGTGEMADRVAQALLATVPQGNGFDQARGYPTEMTFEPVPRSNVDLGDHDPDDVFEQVLDWAGEHAVEQGWCNQFEEIMTKHGLEARRCSTTYDVVVEVERNRADD